MNDNFPDNSAEIPPQEILSLLNKSIFGVRKTVAASSASTAGEENVIGRLSLIMPNSAGYIQHIYCPPTGKNLPLETCLLLYHQPSPAQQASPGIEEIIKALSQSVGTFRWHLGPRLAKVDRVVVEGALSDYLLGHSGRSDGVQPSAAGSDPPTNQDRATSTSLLDIEQPGSRSIGAANDKTSDGEANGEDIVASASDPSNIFDEAEEESLEEQPLSGEVSPLESLIRGVKIREAQFEAAQAVIPVLLRNRADEEALVAHARALLHEIDSNPLPTSTEGLSLGDMIKAIGKMKEREHIAQRLEEQGRALNDERVEALYRLEPHVRLAGSWLEANGLNPRQPSPTTGDEAVAEGDSTSTDDRRIDLSQLPEPSARRSDDSDEQKAIQAEEDVAAGEDSLSDPDFEDQLRELQKGVEPKAEKPVGGRSDGFDGQTRLR